MAALLLDSTVLIDALRGRPSGRRIQEILERGDDVLTTAINVEEIIRGTKDAEVPATDALFAALILLPITAAEGGPSGRWRREFAARGLVLHQADCLIAAAAVTNGARLATANIKDFPMLADRLDHWPNDAK